MQITVYTVNSFTAHGDGGNPAGVVFDADYLDDRQMIAIAAKLGYSETAFVSESAEATHKLRFFTPTEEVDLCGHATIATWSLMSQKGMHRPGTYSQETLAGLLGVNIEDTGIVFMQQTLPRFYETASVDEVVRVLGIPESGLSNVLKPQVVSTGLRDLLVPVKDESTLNAMQPDFDMMTALSEKYDVTGLHVFCLLHERESLAAARNFAPRVGIPEESATGTSNGALICYLREHSALPTGAKYRIEQGKTMDKLSYIYGTFIEDSVWIGGNARVVKEQSIDL
jgi:PhzF family phenazine biosynthesis protein